MTANFAWYGLCRAVLCLACTETPIGKGGAKADPSAVAADGYSLARVEQVDLLLS